MKSIYLILLFVSFLLSCNMNAQELVPLFKAVGSYMEDGWLVIPELQIKKDSDAKLYHNDKLCFEPNGDYALCIYEVFENQYIIITPIDKSKKENSAIFVLPKREIKLYSLSSQKIYDANVMNKKILKIEESKKEIKVLGTNNKTETIKMK